MIKINRTKGAAAQGDCFLIPVDELPDGLRHRNSKVVAHSETGHHHVARGNVQVYEHPQDPMVCYLRCEGVVELEHQRPWDTHETLQLPPGDYRVLRQREGAPEGWRRVED